MSYEPIYKYTKEQVSIANIKPFEHFSHSSVIPPQSSTFTEIFPNLFQLPSLDRYYNTIELVRVNLNTGGIYNIPVSNVALVNGVLTPILPGFYSLTDLETILMITVPTSGAGSYKATTTVALDLTTAPDIQAITGFPAIVAAGVTSTQIFNLMNGFDTMYVQCNLTNRGNPAGQVYLCKVVLTDFLGNPDPNISVPLYLNVPIVLKSPNSVTWSFFKGNTVSSDPVPWYSQSNVIIFFHVYSYLKDVPPSI